MYLISTYHAGLYQDHYKAAHAGAPTGVVSVPRHQWQSPFVKWVAHSWIGAGCCPAEPQVLDYGSGPAEALRHHLPWTVRSYDPGVPHLAAPPEPADFVACVHALEHVEPECVTTVLTHIRSLALVGTWLAISLEPSTKLLPDGSPWHSVVWSKEQWLAELLAIFPGFQERAPLFKGELLGTWVRPSSL